MIECWVYGGKGSGSVTKHCHSGVQKPSKLLPAGKHVFIDIQTNRGSSIGYSASLHERSRGNLRSEIAHFAVFSGELRFSLPERSL